MVFQPARQSIGIYPHLGSLTLSRPNLNLTRIVGMAGAITLNTGLLLLLLVPLTSPIPVPREEVISLRWVLPEKKPAPIPPLTPVAKIVPPQASAQQPKTKPEIRPVEADPIIVEDGALLANTADTITDSIVDAIGIAPQVLPGVRLEYERASSPPYPRDALRARLQGIVLLQVTVDTNGRPLEVSIRESSGHRALDEAARRHVLKNWRFRPALQNGSAVQAIGLVPIAFRLD